MVGQLSGGQRQRVALGRALAINPRILLLDEPLSNLDARIREDVRHEIKALQKSLGITAIHVTHDREEAMVMADRIVILDAGTIAQQGVPEEIYNRPASPFVASFLGAANAIRLTAHPEAGATRIEAGPFNGPARVSAANGLAGAVVVHFRSEAAELVEPDADCGDDLVLRGQVRQVSYPGGFWRYAVAVGEQQFMVDDQRRREPGAAVGIRLASSAVHLFPDRR
jgi:ABC-type Fe3+/spermidine/putrescine transport system ATPase subunit